MNTLIQLRQPLLRTLGAIVKVNKRTDRPTMRQYAKAAKYDHTFFIRCAHELERLGIVKFSYKGEKAEYGAQIRVLRDK